jgi:methylmalonyl-CoA mutase N-terminal domain/subunit
MDEALALPSQHAATIALRTQQIIAEESGVVNSVDPLGGSYFLEALTDKMESQVYEYFDKINDLGGVLPAIDQGFFQGEISDSAYRYQREIDLHVRTVIGVNAYKDQKNPEIPLLVIDPEGHQNQVERLEKLKKERDSGRVGQTLDQLRIACQGTENTMPYILEAVHAFATLGEITQVMKDVFGVYREENWI